MDKLTELFRANGVPLPVRFGETVGKTISRVQPEGEYLVLFFTDGTGCCIEYDRRMIRSCTELGDWAHSYAFAARCAFATDKESEDRLFDMQHAVGRLLDERAEELERIEYARLKAKYGG